MTAGAGGGADGPVRAVLNRLLCLGCCLGLFAAAAGCTGREVQAEDPLLAREFRDTLLIFEAYLDWYEGVARHLAEDPEGVSERERAKFVAIGRSLKKMSRGMNVAVGNYPALASESGSP